MENTIHYIYEMNDGGELVYNDDGKRISEIQLKCAIASAKKSFSKYWYAKRNGKHPRTIGAIKNDFYLYLRTIQTILREADSCKAVLEVSDEQKRFFNLLNSVFNLQQWKVS